MKVCLGFCPAAAVAVVGMLCMASGLAAQEGNGSPPAKSKQQPVPKGGPAPRTADGHPDLSGVWFGGTAGGFTYNPALRKQFDPKVTPEEPPQFQPWAAAKIKFMTATDFELGRASVNCMPRGVPGMFLINPYPFQIVQNTGLFVQLDELNNNFRVVQTDGRAHDPDPDPSYDDDGVGSREGENFVMGVN